MTDAETGMAPETTEIKSVQDALAYAHAYGQVAAFLAANPDLAKKAMVFLAEYTNLYVAEDPVERIVDAARRGREFGAEVEEYASGGYGGVKIRFGPLHIKVYAQASEVCSRVVVGVVEDVQYALSFDLDGAPRKSVEVSA